MVDEGWDGAEGVDEVRAEECEGRGGEYGGEGGGGWLHICVGGGEGDGEGEAGEEANGYVAPWPSPRERWGRR